MKIFVPKSYSELTAAQSRWLFRTLAKNPELNSVEFKTFAFLRFAGLHVITKDYESALPAGTPMAARPDRMAQTDGRRLLGCRL